ncbi:c-type cytochrome biogenesis protein CcmI [Variovorax robiniae]|uniref:C-type cytochrome biogenesis protein CcmI n=1 Tax=Variovorax robiniae TaxID=1836199 RepID=A0ABU8X6H2_9BURK
MTGLWLAALALLLLALLFVLPPLLKSSPSPAVAPSDLARRLFADQLAQLDRDLQSSTLDAQDRAQAIEDLKRQALAEAAQTAPQRRLTDRPWMSRGIAAVVSVGLPTAGLLLYLQVGNPGAVATQMLAAERAGTHESGGQDMERMVSRLAQRLRAQPDDVEGWIVLARSYEVLQRYDDAVLAWQKAMALAPNQPQLLADYADALGSARDGDLGGPVQAAIDAALGLDANHPKALALAGMAAFKQGDLATARQRWEKLLALLPPDSEAAAQVSADLAQLDASAKTTTPGTKPAQGGKHVGGTVAIASALRDKASPQDTVFVLAKTAATGRMPVAVLRLQVKDLPAKFVLDDSLAMSPELSISRFDAVSVEVRVSRSGQPATQPGDLVGSIAQVPLGQEGVALLADRVVP